MDKLANKFFNNPTSFGKAMELLMAYKREVAKDSWESVEDFLMGLDEGEEYLLQSSLDYSEEVSKQKQGLADEIQSLRKCIEMMHRTQSVTNINLNENSSECKADTPYLSDLVERYIDDLKLGWTKGKEEVNEIDVRPRLQLFIDIVGNKKAGDVIKEDVLAFKEVIKKYPKNKTIKPRYRDLTIAQLIKVDVPDEDRLSVTSINKNLEKVSSFLKWCKDSTSSIKEDLSNPLKKRLKKETEDDEDRDKLSDADIQRLFESKQYKNGNHKHASHYWVPLLGLFTGARLNELCQLYKSDVYKDNDSGIYVIDINLNSPDKRVKKEAHKRLVPIHKKLIELGFIDFVEATKTERLFPELPLGKTGYWEALSKWFNRTYRNSNNCNVGQMPNEKKCFHSFRHNVSDQLQEKDVQPAKVSRLIGQKPGDTSVTVIRYKKRTPVAENYRIINLLSYPINYSAIRPWKSVRRSAK